MQISCNYFSALTTYYKCDILIGVMHTTRKMKLWGIVASVCLVVGSVVVPHYVSAHEVYVLSPDQIAKAVGMPPFNMLATIRDDLGEFAFWAFLGILTVIFIFFISTLRFVERKLDPFLTKIRKYASFISRITIGLSFLAAAYYQATYGPELPLANMYGSLTTYITIILVVIGILVIIGLYARLAALVALCIYAVAVRFYGTYMLTYVNYLGEILVLLILGGHGLSLDSYLASKNPAVQKELTGLRLQLQKFQQWLAPKSFAILRVLFGIALIYASAYAKIIHNNLALFTVLKYHLDVIFHLEPHFLVLGAAIVELLIGTFIIFGIEIRFISFFFLAFLTASLFFFGEVVWPHIILIGIPIAFIFYGYDKYSIEGYFFRKKKYEPVL
jgi:uncharacterized membrane protein YphA (DoxX/SURF4 family)